MSDAVLITLILAIPQTIGAVAALAAWRESKHTTAVAAVIEGHVNSAATRDATIIASQEIQLAMLRDTIAKQDATVQLLAQNRAVGRASDATPTAEP